MLTVKLHSIMKNVYKCIRSRNGDIVSWKFSDGSVSCDFTVYGNVWAMLAFFMMVICWVDISLSLVNSNCVKFRWEEIAWINWLLLSSPGK